MSTPTPQSVCETTAEPMLSVQIVMVRLGVSDKTVRRLLARGELAAHRIGRQLRISEHDLAAYLRAQRRGGRSSGQDRSEEG